MGLDVKNVWEYDRPVRIGFYPDAHCMPGHDRRPIKAIANHFHENEVDAVVNIGDFNDMHSLSSYDKGKLAIEGARISDDLAYSEECLNLFAEELDLGCDLAITEGNHEHRLYRLENDDPQLKGSFGDDPFHYKAYGYHVLPYLDILRINGLSFSHAFVNPASLIGSIQGGTAEIRMRNIGFPHVAGHQHGPLVHGQRKLGDGSPLSTLILGCAHTESHAYWGRGRDVYRGACILDNVWEGSYDLQVSSLESLLKRYT